MDDVRGRVTALSNKEITMLDGSGHTAIIARDSVSVVRETA